MELISFKNMFTLIGLTLTVYLISDGLLTYKVEKPTTTSKEERHLDITHLPEVLVCLDPGLDYQSLAKYGYYSSYWAGVMHTWGKFVGWNGGEKETKSSRDILEEALLVPDGWGSNKTRLIRDGFFWFWDPSLTLQAIQAEVKTVILSYPWGRCVSIIAPLSNMGREKN